MNKDSKSKVGLCSWASYSSRCYCCATGTGQKNDKKSVKQKNDKGGHLYPVTYSPPLKVHGPHESRKIPTALIRL